MCKHGWKNLFGQSLSRKQVSDPISTLTSTSEHFHMCSRGITLLLWARPSPLGLIFKPCLASFKESCLPKKVENAPRTILEHFLASYMALQPSLAPIVCDLQMLCTIIFFNKGNQKLKMFIFNMYFHKTCPKKGVVCNNARFPFCFLPNQRHKNTMGKQMLHLNC
jgi:hypothetical protein